jgi:uncharacterized protein (DUF1330 family)
LTATPPPRRVTILPEYQAAAKIRDEASTADFVIIEGYEG